MFGVLTGDPYILSPEYVDDYIQDPPNLRICRPAEAFLLIRFYEVQIDPGLGNASHGSLNLFQIRNILPV